MSMETETTTADLRAHQDLAVHLVRDVFQTMLGSDAWPDSTVEGEARRYPVVGAIHFAGPWKGAVLAEFDHPLAYAVTARLMGVPTPAEVDADVRDAVGELTNMIAGNLKAILPPDTGMSMPTVVEGRDFTLSVIGANETSRLAFGAPDGSLCVTLVQMRR